MEDKFLNEKFTEWTKSLSPKSARISIYQHIRDIPYSIVSELRDPKTGPAGLIRMNKGSCVPKHFLMALMMSELGLGVKYVSYLFDWNDPAIKFPPDIKKVVKNMPITAHLATKVNIDGRWVLVDATYDLALKKAGFPVNESWDGVSDTKNAVIPIEEVVHESLQERLSFAGKRVGEYTDKERSAYAEFAKRLNYWLEELRRR
jgi:transglutaminase-like putative cysteine protease